MKRQWQAQNKPLRGHTAPIKSILEHLVHKMETQLIEHDKEVFEIWADVVGEDIARHTYPSTLEDRHLYVDVDTSAWLFELSKFREEGIRKELNERLEREAVAKIVFRQGTK